ncbi:hexameric tyrosine-coordinated heme protein [Virgibacillus sp. YIM 98842]|jgi:hypothetical protein|uniref:hexameric tyrosine-coordinated heme protein n=1 Tax=Virgibacillus sp. YIM 98842 TaxID=2663533 RepID=UPI001F09AC86|nr:hexameric tyrosine-coordinated heme protein [Virgibacillus sp. YIM 98842]
MPLHQYIQALTHLPAHMYSYIKYLKEVNGMSNGQLQMLQTPTPEEGFDLAIRLAQKGVEVTQPSEEIRQMLRPVYSRNVDSLIATSQVIAIHFQTIAAANNYWRAWTPHYG